MTDRPMYGIPKSGKTLLLKSAIQLKESGVPLTIGIQHPGSTKTEIQNLESGCMAWNRESKTVVDSPYNTRIEIEFSRFRVNSF